mgnify:CR=1 FL=1
MKRIFDLSVSLILTIAVLPIISIVLFFVWIQDFKNPFYLAPRVSKNGGSFTMIKVRSMVVNADKNKIDSTKSDDPRITKVGRFVRKFKIGELGQIINVIKGDMSLVGPRPQVSRDVDLYSDEEKLLLSVKPGITDFASIVFSDEGKILEGDDDPDLLYNQIIRPWKSRLCIIYIKNKSLLLDVKLIILTAIVIFSRNFALSKIKSIITNLTDDENLIKVASREIAPFPYPPPGLEEIVTSRN